jgi:2-C-methyl-D-erythritol 4-phosphate cytidylyltransferase
VATTVDRSDLVEAATPQGAKRSLLTDALSRSGDGPPTDEMQALESIGLHPQAVEGDSMNFKITTSDDLALARRLLGEGT